jgi:hypothetical protein
MKRERPSIVRTTLDIDEDVLVVAKQMASERGISTGKVVSELARRSLTQREPRRYRNGIPLLPVRPGGEVITMEFVNRLRDEEE